MDRRLLLHAVLCKLLNCPKTGDACRAYFQPPPNTEMQYDCIVYERSRMDTDFADNLPYTIHNRYQLTAIYRNPDSGLPGEIAKLPRCSHERHFTSDNLNHDIFNLYF